MERILYPVASKRVHRTAGTRAVSRAWRISTRNLFKNVIKSPV